MQRQDARKLSHDKLTELRRRAVAAVQNGESPEDVARVMGVNRVTVYGWLALYRSGGWGKLDAKKRGGRKPKLDAHAVRWIYKTVTLGNPNQLKLPFVLWSAKLLAGVIEKKLDALVLIESQFIEGGANGSAETSPKTVDERDAKKAQVRESFKRRFAATANQWREKLVELYGQDAGSNVQYAEAFEICEYGRRPSKEEILKLFPIQP